MDNLGGGGACGWHTDDVARRFIPLTEVSEILDISAAQAYALVRSGDLPAIKVGGRGQWRVETVELEAYIQRMYAETRDLVTTRSDPGRPRTTAPTPDSRGRRAWGGQRLIPGHGPTHTLATPRSGPGWREADSDTRVRPVATPRTANALGSGPTASAS